MMRMSFLIISQEWGKEEMALRFNFLRVSF